MIEQQAADYFLAQVTDPTPELKREIDEWLGGNPAHAVAYARAARAWDMTADLSLSSIDGTVHASDRVNETRWLDFEDKMFTRRRVLAAGAAAGIAGAVGLGVWHGRRGIATAVGEVRDVTLPDGSIMHLNTDSRVVVAYSGKRRLIQLLAGEAYFDVARNPDRPFDVEVNGSTVRALGTAFNLRVLSELVELTVTHGLVGVHTSEGRTGKVPAGDGAYIKPQDVVVASLRKDEVEQRTLWRSNVIELNGESLGQAIAEFNRYRAVPIVIGDRRLSALRVGGRFRTDEADQFLTALKQTLPLDVIRQDDGGVLLIYQPPAESGESAVP
ncbi:FecR family protein [Novosphingobium album (ex Hu et al. 2023)]|uniref:FecR domain-containing protein n=1 Tax=Novosphingobium album (ex Hu et al. 2023) TaxID=2930093 RepID=A0ABT0B0C0_9SPHN|nr:FecR domain-containing protein [Novosphingobium album (ex Hu et al. 2023)]MCJ2178460.1 FecR domain-containing protein [Novosphingobium album (ex Hu et al. 2023)]